MSQAQRFHSFLKDNGHLISKLIVNQIGMTVFGWVLAMACVSNNALLMGVSVFSVLFYMYLLYSACWEIGTKDQVKVAAGRMKRQPFKAFFCSLLANIPNAIFAILAIIGYYSIVNMATGDPLWATNLYGVCNAIARAIQGMYIGIIALLNPSNNPLALLVIILPSIFFSSLGYLMGLNGRSVSALFGIDPYRQSKR